MGTLKSVFQNADFPLIQCCKPITKYETSFAQCFSTLLRGGRGWKHKNVQIAVFPIIFIIDCLKKTDKLTCSILRLFVLNDFEGMQLAIKSL